MIEDTWHKVVNSENVSAVLSNTPLSTAWQPRPLDFIDMTRGNPFVSLAQGHCRRPSFSNILFRSSPRVNPLLTFHLGIPGVRHLVIYRLRYYRDMQLVLQSGLHCHCSAQWSLRCPLVCIYINCM